MMRYLCAALAIILFSLASPARALDVWVIDDGLKVRPDAPVQTINYIWDAQSSSARTFAAGNEYAALQVVVRSDKPVKAVSIAAAPLRGTHGIIDVDRLDLYREHYLYVAVPSVFDARHPVPDSGGEGWYPEQLVPLDAKQYGAPFDLEPGRNEVFWVDIYVPRGTPAGIYRGPLTVTAGGKPAATVNVELRVYPYALPETTHFANWFYYGPEQLAAAFDVDLAKGVLPIEDKYYRMAHKHRMNLATEPYPLGNPKVVFNWNAWWARYGKYVDGSAYKESPGAGVGAMLWPLGYAGQYDDKIRFEKAMKDAAAFLKEKGCLDKFFFYGIDEPNSHAAYDTVRKVSRWFHEAVDKDIPLMLTEQVKPQDKSWGSLVGFVDIWDSPSITEEEIQERHAAGEKVWTYNGGHAGYPYVDTPAIDVTTWAMMAWRLNLDAWFMWDAAFYQNKIPGHGKLVDTWKDPLTFDESWKEGYPVADSIRLNGDGVFIYPGKDAGIDGPVAGFRMKAFRRGAQDYEYLWLLGEAGRQTVADGIARELCPKAHEWDTNPADWYAARHRMAETLSEAIEAAAVAGSEDKGR